MTLNFPARFALFFAAAAPILAADAPVSILFHEPFEDELSAGWSWVRENKAAWKLGDGALHLRLLPGNLWEKENDARNLLLRPPPEGVKQFSAEVTESHAPAAFGEQAGLLWYRDDDNYIKLVKEWYDGKTWVVFAAERAGKADYREAECADETVTFRLTIDGDKVSASYRPAGAKEWRTLDPFDFAARDDKTGPARIGLTAHHGPVDAPRWAVFRDFRVSSLPANR